MTLRQRWRQAISFAPVRRAVESHPSGSVYVIAGLRRSGNHAVITWLANALAEQSVDLHELDVNIRVSPSGAIVHLNDLKPHRHHPDYTVFARHTDTIRSADHLLLSYEDELLSTVDSVDPLHRHPGHRLHVTRSTLNLLASRLAGSTRSRRSHADAVNLEIDERRLDAMLANRAIAQNPSANPTNDWIEVSFDRWLVDPDERRRLLQRLGLHVDLAPSISTYGLGSSFTGTERVPETRELLHRWEQVDWPAPLVERLLEPRHHPLFTATELQFLTERHESGRR